MREILPTLDAERFDWLAGHAAWIGYGGPRFVLSLTPVDPAPNRAVVIVQVDEPGNVPRAAAQLREIPPGHSIELDGIITQSGEGRAALLANMPLCLAIVLVLPVAQFDSFRKPLIILGTIPLVIIGAAIGLYALNADFGFMPILGVLSLAGIILNNGIVLIDRIDIERARRSGTGGGAEAIVTASVRRLRPILISTLTTVLCLLSLIVSRDPHLVMKIVVSVTWTSAV